ncbi:MAG TPA: ABC transporter permease [Thermoanaerobaculia bacterium]|nr:ABC transporter permease [Thermoanaerobaculia bacterium]
MTRRSPGRRFFRFPWRTAAQVAADVDDELEFHLEKVAEELVEEGWSPEAARTEARRRFGDLEGTRAYCRALDKRKETQMRWTESLGEVGQDLKFAGRQLAKSPGFTLVAVLTLALGVGATTAIFSVVYGILLRPLPFAEPDRIVRAYPTASDGSPDSFSVPNYLDWSREAKTIEAASAMDNGTVTLAGDGGEPERLEAFWVRTDFFRILGLKPIAGRTFSPGEDKPAEQRVVLISEELWQRRFGRDRSVIGRRLDLNGVPSTVVGILGRDGQYPANADVWLPLAFEEQMLTQRGAYYLNAIAKLAPGATLEEARAEAKVIGDRLAREYPRDNEGTSVGMAPLQEFMVGDVRTPLLVLLGAVLLVLLIACANVANLLLVRAASREGEIAIRTALGAGRTRIVRQLLTESLLLALVGGAAGVLLAVWMTRALVALAPRSTPRLEEVGVDGSVLLFTLGLTLLTGVLFGLVPALQASRPNLVGTLKEGTRGSRGRAATRVRSLLVVTETALAVVLLAGAGLLIRSFGELQKVDVGFRPEGVVKLNLALPESQYPEEARVRTFAGELLTSVRALPGVKSAALAAWGLPLSGTVTVISYTIEGHPPPPNGYEGNVRIGIASPEYFRTMGIPVLRGRDFTGQDRNGAPQVVVINQTAARQMFPGEDPMGKHVTLGWSVDGVRRGGEVVGIVGDFKQDALQEDPEPHLFLPFEQAPVEGMTVVLRTATEPAAVATAVREKVHALDPNLAIYGLQTLEEVVASSASQPKFYMLLLGGFSAIALLLAAVGIYGVIAYGVRQRTQEIGIRLALGASQDRVLRMVVGQGMALAVAGALAGLVGALLATRGMRSLLYQVSASDPMIYTGVALMLVLVAAVASWLPARRAARTDPQLVLRGEV